VQRPRRPTRPPSSVGELTAVLPGALSGSSGRRPCSPGRSSWRSPAGRGGGARWQGHARYLTGLIDVASSCVALVTPRGSRRAFRGLAGRPLESALVGASLAPCPDGRADQKEQRCEQPPAVEQKGQSEGPDSRCPENGAGHPPKSQPSTPHGRSLVLPHRYIIGQWRRVLLATGPERPTPRRPCSRTTATRPAARGEEPRAGEESFNSVTRRSIASRTAGSLPRADHP